MADRRSFLGSISGAAATLALAGRGDAQTASPTATTTASASPKPISAAARAQAEEMRRFDAHLTPAQLDVIARGIDDANATAEKLNPHGRVLKNADEPVTQFHLGLVR